MPRSLAVAAAGWLVVLTAAATSRQTARGAESPGPDDVAASSTTALHHAGERAQQSFDGQAVFRFDTFGDEQLWTKVLRMHDAIRFVAPKTALAVGLKVDVDALPATLIAALQAGQVDLTSPAVTLELLRLDAVVGIIGRVDELDQLVSIGTTCALCHSTVDNSLATGIGKRLDGWPNRDLNVGMILGLAPGAGSGPQGRVPRVGTREIRSAAPCVRRREYHPCSAEQSLRCPCSSRRPMDCRESDSRPIPVTGRSPIGTAMSVCRKWAGRATSAIRASASPSYRGRIGSRRSCRSCATIS